MSITIYDTLEDARAAESGLVVLAQGQSSPKDAFESDWGYRLRGHGLPGGGNGWLLTFAGTRSITPAVGFLIAYEIDQNSKTGKVAVLRRAWTHALDDNYRKRVQADPAIWNTHQRDERGEADIDDVDKALP